MCFGNSGMWFSNRSSILAECQHSYVVSFLHVCVSDMSLCTLRMSRSSELWWMEAHWFVYYMCVPVLILLKVNHVKFCV